MTSPFISYKSAFFKKSFNYPNQTMGDVQNVGNVDFVFLSNHLGTIEHEFNELYAALKINGENRRQFWLFCYQLCHMLKTYYATYSPEKAEEYTKLSEGIARRIDKIKEPVVPELSFSDKVNRDINSLKTLPFSSARLRDTAAKATMQRISTRFTMLTLKELLLMARQYHLLDMFEKLFGRSVNIDILDAPLGIYNALSVGIFTIRFSINMAMLLKHVFNPVGPENELTMIERLCVELKKRHYQLVNDFVWTIVNALTNYSAYFHIAAPLATTLMAGFLAFDASWLSFTLYLVELDYLKKLNEYQAYKTTLAPGSFQWLMANDQIEQLERSTEKMRMTLRFYIVAASLLVGSLTAAFLLVPAALVPVCFLVSNLAVAMYLSGHLYGAYKEKCLIVEQNKVRKGFDLFKAPEDVKDAWDDLVLTMLKNTVVPFIIISAFTISVPAAVALTVAYVASQSGCDYLSKTSVTDVLNSVGLWKNNAETKTGDSMNQSLVVLR